MTVNGCTAGASSGRLPAIAFESWDTDQAAARLRGQTVVINYSGAAMTHPHLRDLFAHDVGLLSSLGLNLVIVHGGQPTARLTEAAKEISTPGRRTSGSADETMVDVEMALRLVNSLVVDLLTHHKVPASGFGGWESSLILASGNRAGAFTTEIADFGRTGDVESVNPKPVRALQERRIVPVIASLGIGADGLTYNIKTELVAGAVAASLGAAMIIYLADAPGVMAPDGCRYRRLTRWVADSLVSEGVLGGPLQFTVEGAVRALNGGAGRAYIIDGRVPHALVRSFRTRHIHGTEVVL